FVPAVPQGGDRAALLLLQLGARACHLPQARPRNGVAAADRDAATLGHAVLVRARVARRDHLTMRRGVAAIPHAPNARDMTAPRYVPRRHSNRWTPNGLTKVDPRTARAHGLPNAAAMAATSLDIEIETARPSIDLVHLVPRRPRDRERRLRR